MYSFSEIDFSVQVFRSKGWGEPTDELLDMMEEMIVEEARNDDCTLVDKTKMIEFSINDFESGGLLMGLVKNSPQHIGVIDHFKSSICCTFKHFKRKT